MTITASTTAAMVGGQLPQVQIVRQIVRQIIGQIGDSNFQYLDLCLGQT